jgi:CheY-like chemotaxis protein
VGSDVVEAESGENALNSLEQFAFDVVITDLRMPGIDGTHVIEAARSNGIRASSHRHHWLRTVKDAVDAIKRGALGLHCTSRSSSTS